MIGTTSARESNPEVLYPSISVCHKIYEIVVEPGKELPRRTDRHGQFPHRVKTLLLSIMVPYSEKA